MSEEQPRRPPVQVYNNAVEELLEKRRQGIPMEQAAKEYTSRTGVKLPLMSPDHFIPCSAGGHPILTGKPIFCPGCTVMLCAKDFDACSSGCDIVNPTIATRRDTGKRGFIRLDTNIFNFQGRAEDKGLLFNIKPIDADINQLIPAVQAAGIEISGLVGGKLPFHRDVGFSKSFEPKVWLTEGHGGRLYRLKPIRVVQKWQFYRTHAVMDERVFGYPVGNEFRFHPHIGSDKLICLGEAMKHLIKTYQITTKASVEHPEGFPADFLKVLNDDYQIIVDVLHDVNGERVYASIVEIKKYAVPILSPPREGQVEPIVLSGTPDYSGLLMVRLEPDASYRDLSYNTQQWNFALSITTKLPKKVRLCYGKYPNDNYPTIVVCRNPVATEVGAGGLVVDSITLKIDGKDIVLRGEQCKGTKESYFARFPHFIPIADDNGHVIGWIHDEWKHMVIRYNIFAPGSPMREIFRLFMRMVNLTRSKWFDEV